MRIASTVARYVLGLFTVFGLNGFLQFIPAPAPPPPQAAQFVGALLASHYMVPVFLIQLVCGLLFLANRYVPLALTMLAPVLVNILLFHMTMDLKGIVPGIIATICWLLVFSRVRPAFAGLFQRRVPEPVTGHR